LLPSFIALFCVYFLVVVSTTFHIGAFFSASPLGCTTCDSVTMGKLGYVRRAGFFTPVAVCGVTRASTLLYLCDWVAGVSRSRKNGRLSFRSWQSNRRRRKKRSLERWLGSSFFFECGAGCLTKETFSECALKCLSRHAVAKLNPKKRIMQVKPNQFSCPCR